jgi:hypothetical protein
VRRHPALWHYTDTAGATGIIREGVLRFGDAAFLNDRTERWYGRNLVAEVLAGEAPIAWEMFGRHRPSIGTILRVAADFAREAPLSSTLFLCSFSETPQSISQWQRYAADGHGYCLGFDAKALSRSGSGALVKMAYRRSRQIDIISRQIAKLVRAYLEGAFSLRSGLSTGERTAAAAMRIVLELEPVTLELKNPTFEDEKEWRLIREFGIADAELSLEFAIRGAYPKPFLPISFGTDAVATPLPLRQVVCGPRLDEELAIPAMQQLLRASGYPHALVTISELRRTWR